MIYDIEHRTEYRFHRPVELGLHRLSFRPRDGHDMRVLATALEVSPQPQRVDLVHDVYGNSVALVLPGGPAALLSITSRFTVEHLGTSAHPALATASEARWMPPAYRSAERLALHPFLVPSHDDPGHRLRAWAQPFADEGSAGGGPRQTLASMTQAIRNGFAYTPREEEGVQTPQQTLRLGGSCRDFATLMIDALRHIGIAARFVSGYLYSRANGTGVGNVGGGATHAWVQCYLPDSGWISVDPTNNLIGGSDLIRTAVARDASEVAPLSGEWFGDKGDFAGMAVDVQVVARAD